MSIIGIGIDVIEISRIENFSFDFINKFAKRILSIQEWNQYTISKNNIHFLAKKFTAKEAASKALGTGINCGITFNQIEIYNNKLGQPKLRFLKNAFQKAKEMSLRSAYISISDEKLYACALVVLEN